MIKNELLDSNQIEDKPSKKCEVICFHITSIRFKLTIAVSKSFATANYYKKNYINELLQVNY